MKLSSIARCTTCLDPLTQVVLGRRFGCVRDNFDFTNIGCKPQRLCGQISAQKLGNVEPYVVRQKASSAVGEPPRYSGTLPEGVLSK